MAEDHFPIDAQTMIPDLLRAVPSARRVLDLYGLRGCGGPWGPAESLEFFSRAHDVPLEQLLDEIRQAISGHPRPVAETPALGEPLGDAIYRPFFRAGIAVVLTLGAAWGAILLVRIALLRSFTAIPVHEINAHGHAQIFGWVGLFVMGFAYQAFPRFKHTSLAHPRWAYGTLWLMLGGLVVRSVLEPLAAAWPWLGIPAVAGSVAEIIAVAIFIAVIAATLWGAKKRLEAYDYYILTALGWFLVQAIYESVYLASTLTAPDRDSLLQLIATWQAPLREIQIHGFAMMMILGASQRIFHYFYGLPAPNPRRSMAALIVLNLALAGIVAGFVLMRLAGHAWVILWYGSILAMAAAVVFLVAGWRIYSPAQDVDRSLKYLRTAYVWLFISLAMQVFLPAYQFGILARFAPESAAAGIGFSHAYYGAIRHAVTVGFISLMIMGVSAKVAPTLGGIDVHRLTPLWVPLALLNIGCAWRVITQILTDYTPAAFPISGISGLLELAALAIWGVHLWRLMSRRAAAESCRPAPILVQLDANRSARPITADQLVAEVLDRHPDLLEIFVSYGFAPLKNPLMRATVARITTIRRACATLDVDLERLLAALNAAADGLPGTDGDPAIPE
ncbi:MAG: DUF1858 domain-containing protein [Pirellulales bacterium]|nr:DUF1858 domain-containing protein [Pirellulales bacterium]